MLTREELVRVAYIPYVIGTLLWDYVDTIRDLACVLKLGAKHLTNRLREIHTLYEQHRSFSIDSESRKKETAHALQFESDCVSRNSTLCAIQYANSAAEHIPTYFTNIRITSWRYIRHALS